MTNRTLSGLLLLFTATPVVFAGAQTLGPDEKELAAYTLTMPTVRKVAAAMAAMNELEAQDPKVRERAKVREEIKALENKDELTEADEQKLEKLREREEALDDEIDRSSGPGDASTITEMEQRIKSYPGAAAILAREGIAPREFAKATLALFQAAMVKGFSQGKADMARLPPGINPANITFVEANEKELAELQKQMQGTEKK
jgi:hypothetical protein